MHSPTVKPFSALILASALAMLTGCASAPVLYQDRTIEVPVPVRTPIDPRLTLDCEPRFDVSSTGPLPVETVLRRLAAVEEALAVCRGQLTELRSIK